MTTAAPSTRHLAVVSAGLSVPSSTRLLADRLTAATTERLQEQGIDAEVDVIELRPLAHALADHVLTGFPNPELRTAVDDVAGADAVIAVTPIFRGSYSGLFKTFVDVLEPETMQGKPVLIGATAGTARHSLALDHALRPLFSYLGSVVVPTGVFAAPEDWAGADAAGRNLAERIGRAADELAALLGAGAATGARTGSALRPADPFADVVPFEQLLRGR